MQKLIYFFVIIMACSYTHSQSQNELENKKVLFVYGGWEGHNPKGCHDLLVPWLKSKGAEVKTSESLNVYSDPNVMENTDLVIHMWTMGKISNEQQEGLLSAIRSGVGIAGWHGGLGDSFRESLHFQWMIGGQFMEHPGGIIDYTVNVTDPEDEIMQGINDFEMHSEQYYMLVDPNIHVLASTTFSGEYEAWTQGNKMPVVWKKHFGKGRVFYSNLGHKLDDFDVPEMFTILKRGIVWASKSKENQNP